MEVSTENDKKQITASKRDRVTIPINRTVKKFALERLKELGGFVPVEVYKSVRSGRGLVSKNDRKAIDIVDTLLAKISSFIVTVPFTVEEGRKMKDFIAAWKDNVRKLRKQLLKKSQPVYFHSMVDEELAKLGSKIKCSDIHLEWYLSRFGADQMQPEKIARAILKYNGGDWRKVRPLVKDGSITVSLDDDTDKIRKAVLRSFLWIYKIQADVVSKDIIDRTENDLQVLKEFEDWCNQDPKDYDYQPTYKSFKARLQTAPKDTPEEVAAQQPSPTPPTVTVPDPAPEEPEEPEEPELVSSLEETEPAHEESKDISNFENQAENTAAPADPFEVAKQKFNAGEKLSPADIAVLIAHKICPACGSRKGLWDNRAKYKPDGTILYDANRNCMECDTRFILSPEGVFKYPVTPKADRQFIQ